MMMTLFVFQTIILMTIKQWYSICIRDMKMYNCLDDWVQFNGLPLIQNDITVDAA